MSLEDQERERSERLAAILNSAAPRKLVIAGPGTGKTFAFGELLKKREGKKLALTFINALRDDLQQRLGHMADVYTFHGFCRWLLHSTPTPGLRANVDYYPALGFIQAEDVQVLESMPADDSDIQKALHLLDDTESLITLILRSGDYYNSVGHGDSVYRVLRQMESDTSAIPDYNQIVVDEYQDFSLLEVSFIEALAKNPILVAGDDDQALYGFKFASPQFIRDLSKRDDYETFELPYCSRCTAIIVDATHAVVAEAQKVGLLKDRLEKRFTCYMPEKKEDSDRYPKIVHAKCSVEAKKTPYMARYIHRRIAEIPGEDVAISRENGMPTALIIGPSNFTEPIAEHLSAYYSDIRRKKREPLRVEPLDGYMRLAKDPKSRLGWRIMTFCFPIDGLKEILRRAVIDGGDIAALVPDDYRLLHESVATTLHALINEENVDSAEQELLTRYTEIPFVDLKERMVRKGQDQDEDDDLAVQAEEKTVKPDQPSIMLTTMTGAKGLQAPHVFVVGLIAGHVPQHDPTDTDVCNLLVALTRATKTCTVVSTQRYAGKPVKPSIFLSWLDPVLDEIRVDKAFLDAEQ